jgi:hypothetical protein
MRAFISDHEINETQQSTFVCFVYFVVWWVCATMPATKSLWLPEGTWIEWFTGATLRGPGLFNRSFALNEIPIYVKAGSVIPMQPKMQHSELPWSDGAHGSCSDRRRNHWR